MGSRSSVEKTLLPGRLPGLPSPPLGPGSASGSPGRPLPLSLLPQAPQVPGDSHGLKLSHPEGILRLSPRVLDQANATVLPIPGVAPPTCGSGCRPALGHRRGSGKQIPLSALLLLPPLPQLFSNSWGIPFSRVPRPGESEAGRRNWGSSVWRPRQLLKPLYRCCRACLSSSAPSHLGEGLLVQVMDGILGLWVQENWLMRLKGFGLLEDLGREHRV